MKIFDVREEREYRFSVFTSTYNRASLLGKFSIKVQKSEGFQA